MNELQFENLFKDALGNCIGCGKKHSSCVRCKNGNKWWGGPCECRICGYFVEHLIVPCWGLDLPYDIHCNNCNNYTMDPKE